MVFGDLVAQDGDYYGREVNLAARIVAVAEPGQVLATAAVADAISEAPGITSRRAETRS